jgi:RadC-like JAB domain-containing protein
MAKIRAIKVFYEELEVMAPGVGEPVRTTEGVLRLVSFLRHAVDEEVWAVVVGGDMKLIGIYQLSKGGRHETLLDPASLYRTVLLCEGSGVFLVHNHPSCKVSPSAADIQTTEKVLLAGFALGVPLLDHIIVQAENHYSFGQAGMLQFLQVKQLKALGMKGLPDVIHPEERANEAREAMAKLGRPEPAVPPLSPCETCPTETPDPCEACAAAGFKTCHGPHVDMELVPTLQKVFGPGQVVVIDEHTQFPEEDLRDMDEVQRGYPGDRTFEG